MSHEIEQHYTLRKIVYKYRHSLPFVSV